MAGQQALALTLPGLSDGDDRRGLRLEDAVAHVVREVESRDLTDVVLVAHSWGSFPATGAAHRIPGRIAALIHVSAPVPRPGVCQNDLMPPEARAYVDALVAGTPDHSLPLMFDAFQQVMMQGEPRLAQRIVFDQLVAQPAAYMDDALQVADVSSVGVRAAYVLARDDRALPLPGRELAAQLDVEPIMVPGTHEALLTHPDDVAGALLKA